MEKFTTISTSQYSAHVQEPIIIDQKQTTRRVFIADINDAKTDTQETLSGTVIHQRKNKKDEWEDISSINLATLKGGEGVRIRFNSTQLRNLHLGLTKLYQLSQKGVSVGENEFVVGFANELMQIPHERIRFIQQLLSKNYGIEIWQELIKTDPDLATRLSFSRIQESRNESLTEFKEAISKSESEDYWQSFFENNQWIFGYGLNYQFLTQTTDQPSYGGGNVFGQGNQKGDYLLNTAAENKFTVLVEIKKPSAHLLTTTKEGKHIKYRNGAYQLSKELLGGISQIQINCKTWWKNSAEPENIDELESKNIYTVQPKGILIIGNTKELELRSEKETFESFRRNIVNPEILTFDELLERANYIVDRGENFEFQKEDEIKENDLPF